MKKLVLLTLVLLGTAMLVWADPLVVEPKPWSYPPMDVRSDVTELEPNGTCATANPIVCGDVFHGVITTGGATGDLDYFSFTVPAAGTVIVFSTDADGTPSVGDSYIYLYNSSCTQVAYDDDSGPGSYSQITYTSLYAGTYYGAVRSYSASYTGNYKAMLTCTAPQPPPVNDLCDGAIEILCNTPINLAGSTQWANDNYTPGVYPTSCTRFPALGKDVTYKFTAPVGSVVNLNYINSADGSIYIVTDCANPTTTCVIGEDSTVTGGLEDIENYAVTTAGTYYIILDEYGTNVWGTWTLTGSIACPTPVENTSWGAVKTLYR